MTINKSEIYGIFQKKNCHVLINRVAFYNNYKIYVIVYKHRYIKALCTDHKRKNN